MTFSRRTLLKAAVTPVVLNAVRPFACYAATPSIVAREPLNQFDYAQVKITGGPFAEQYAAMHAQYLALSNDRLLKVYRQRAGMPAPGADMGGWYDLDGFVPGHSLGQYISGLARVGAATGDAACHQKVRDLVEGFAATLGPENQSILRPKTNLWICYILDKHFAGLIDAATLSQVPQAKELLNRVLDGAQPLLPAKGRDRIGKKNPPYDETYVMPENLFSAAALTGNPAFHDLGVRYLLDREFFDPLAQGADPFPGQHAYSHAIALSSGAAAYLSLGDPKYKTAMGNAFNLLTTQQQFASGGWGPNETFIAPHKGELCASLTTTVDHFETPCGSYAAIKLARYLTRFTSNPSDTRYADNLERVLYNSILAVKSPDSDGDYPYYSTYSPNAIKVYYPKKWPCCSGTLIQTVADYPLNLYFHTADPNDAHCGLYVNQYVPSTLAFAHAGNSIELVQETEYPTEDKLLLVINPQRPVEMTIHLRIPGWIARGASVRVNDKSAYVHPQAGTYVALRRTWRAGDRIELILPQDFRTEPIDDINPRTVALLRGPMQYVALNPQHDLVGTSAGDRLTLPAGLKQIGPQAYVENYAGKQVVFVPLHQVRDQTYTSYFSIA